MTENLPDSPPGGECVDGPGCTAVSHFLSCPDEDFDPTPCCPDPGCPGSPQKPGSCTFPGYADNH